MFALLIWFGVSPSGPPTDAIGPFFGEPLCLQAANGEILQKELQFGRPRHAALAYSCRDTQSKVIAGRPIDPQLNLQAKGFVRSRYMYRDFSGTIRPGCFFGNPSHILAARRRTVAMSLLTEHPRLPMSVTDSGK